jgi:antitoxin component YwqK of YwqJK toxin-antitoxin module
MKLQVPKILLLSLLVLSSFTVEAQKKKFFDRNFKKCKEGVAYYYRVITKEGTQFLVKDYFYENNQLQMEGRYTDKKLSSTSRTGKFVFFYKNGQKSMEGEYVNGRFDQNWTFYFNNGQVKAEGTYDKGNKEGEWVYYHKNGQLNSKPMYKNGEIDGAYNSFYDDGSKRIESTYEKGVLNGKHTYYYEKDNKVSTIKNFLKDSLDGEYQHFFRDGTIAEKGTYSDNKKTGTFEFYHKNGNKSCEVEYKKGKFTKGTFFDEDGKKLSKKIQEDDLVNSAEYIEGNDAMFSLIFKTLGEKADVAGANRVKYEQEFYVTLRVDAEGNVIDIVWEIPDEDNDEFEDDFSFKKYITVAIESFPKFKPAKHFNRNVESNFSIYLPVNLGKK